MREKYLFYRRVKDLREDNDKTQEEIARLLNTTQQQYYKYENGIREMPMHHFVTLSKYYNVSGLSCGTYRHTAKIELKHIKRQVKVEPIYQLAKNYAKKALKSKDIPAFQCLFAVSRKRIELTSLRRNFQRLSTRQFLQYPHIIANFRLLFHQKTIPKSF